MPPSSASGRRLSIEEQVLAGSTDAGLAGALRRRGNGGLYGVLDQLIYRLPGTSDQGVGLFARLAASPADRNLVDLYADGGLTFKGLLFGREDDTFGVGLGLARISARAGDFDRDVNALAGLAAPVRDYEAVIEVTYQAQIIPGWTVQPDFQYIIHPGGNVADPGDPFGLRRVKDAAVIGVRTTLRY